MRSPASLGSEPRPKTRIRNVLRFAILSCRRVIQKRSSIRRNGVCTRQVENLSARSHTASTLSRLHQRDCQIHKSPGHETASPAPRSDEVVRPRLLEAMDRGTRAKLTLIVTPAGYGKSTLAAQWQRRAEQARCWITLDQNDNDPLVFFDYLVGALTRSIRAFARRRWPLGSPSSISTQQIVHSLLNETATSTRPFVVILDDYHTITSPEVQSAVSQIIRGMPVNMSVVIISRAEPGLPTLQMAAHGELVELGPNELSFTREETKEFLIVRQALDISEPELDVIVRWCEGWPVALRLVSKLMRGHSHGQIQELLETLPENVPSVGIISGMRS